MDANHRNVCPILQRRGKLHSVLYGERERSVTEHEGGAHVVECRAGSYDHAARAYDKAAYEEHAETFVVKL